jgi:hypothetical protein
MELEDMRILCDELAIDFGQFPADHKATAELLARLLQKQKRTAKALASVQRSRPDVNLPSKVLHLVGSPIETETELQWQVTSAYESESVYQSDVQVEATRTGQLLSSGEIPAGLTALIILQGEPIDRLGIRVSSDREEAGRIRTFAHKLIRAGAPAVLSLPPLPYDLVPIVVQSVAQALDLDETSAPDVRRLLDAVGEVRRRILGWVQAADLPGDDTQRAPLEELALDVCVFAGSERVPEMDSVARVSEQDYVQGSVTRAQISTIGKKSA